MSLFVCQSLEIVSHEIILGILQTYLIIYFGRWQNDKYETICNTKSILKRAQLKNYVLSLLKSDLWKILWLEEIDFNLALETRTKDISK